MKVPERSASSPPPGGMHSTYYYFFKDAGSAMAIADKGEVLVTCNDRFIELLQSLSGTAVDITGNNARLGSFLDFLPTHDAVRFSNLFSKLANEDTGLMDFKTPYKDKSGEVHWLRVYAWRINLDPRIDLSGRGPFIGFIMHDETVEIEAENRLQEEMQIAEKTMVTKSLFLATMSHEIRTPIQTIIGMTELLEDTRLNKQQLEYARQVQYSAEVLLSLVNNIMDFSKIEAGKMEVEYTPFSPAQIIEQAVEMLAVETERKGLKTILKLCGEAKKNILGDPGKFRQVVINLVKNAIKFTSSGTITISTLTALGDARIRTITVSVADTGIGIPEAARERLFTTFTQADSSHTRRFGGSGLGLAISRNMVELMGGAIEMIPNPGGGSIFRFTIPAEIVGVPAAETPQTKFSSAKLAGILLKTKSGFNKILIVEDHPVNRNLLDMIINKLGIETFCAEDGLEALELAGSNSFDLILMDIQMPRMNGYEAAAELRKRGYTNPLIAVTAGVLVDEQRLCWEAGFDDILPKPFKRPQVEQILEKWKGKTSSFTSGESQPEFAKETEAAGVFSKEYLLDTFMDNEESARSLLVRFIERTSDQMEKMTVFAQEQNWEEIRLLAHMIKGSSMTLSGMELGQAAGRLEMACKCIDIAEIKPAFDSTIEAYKRFKTAAESYLQT